MQRRVNLAIAARNTAGREIGPVLLQNAWLLPEKLGRYCSKTLGYFQMSNVIYTLIMQNSVDDKHDYKQADGENGQA